jgi:alkylation response protein AidB-like acyl-CoA dehydrogenase
VDLGLSEEQTMLKTMARDFLTDKCPTTLVKQMEEDERGYSTELWKEMVELGWMGLVVPERYGGAGMTFLDLAILMEEIGRACLPGPLFSTVVLGGLTMMDSGNEEQKERFLPQIATGKGIFTLALTEADARYNADSIKCKATSDRDNYSITGTKLFVPDAHIADYIICVIRSDDQKSNEDGISMFIIDAKTPGIRCVPLKTMAGDKLFEVVFDQVSVPKENLLGELNRAWGNVEKIIERAAVARCCEMVGGARKVLEMTVDYAKERVQFGRPIGSFQAIQHHCANIAIDVEGSRLITYQAAWMLSEDLPCAKQVAMAKAWTSEACRRLVLLAHQVHGAIGFTLDHDLQLYTRRIKEAEVTFGDAHFHKEKVAEAMGL